MRLVGSLASGIGYELISVSRRLDREAHEADALDDARIRLEKEAMTMLSDFLGKTRTLRRKGGGSRGLDSRKLDMVHSSLFLCHCKS
jgi:hypothetical protein